MKATKRKVPPKTPVVKLPPPPPKRGVTTPLPHVREKAFIYYVSAQYEPVLADMSKLTEMEGVHPNTLAKWRDADGWVEKRRVFQERVYAKFSERASERIARSLDEAVRKLDPIRIKMEEALLGISIDPKDISPTDLIRTYVRVIESQQRLHTALVERLTPAPDKGREDRTDAGERGLPQPPPPKSEPEDSQESHEVVLPPQEFTLEEARAAAAAVLQLRNAQVQKQLQPPPPPEPTKTRG